MIIYAIKKSGLFPRAAAWVNASWRDELIYLAE